ncbi:uroporphyrinogen-III C-methyltransferase [Agromyces badenianii]|uniref:uroporphyrinogen-III C-methyltransferase n=1 Tax=Agromyces badenianii TaxID=2080742 RepID=A0A2S0WWN8_9MICO|nr:uroporphyrinogen-III C-methyltransferase [Agromyces badenianii]AWB95767.1 uroporphyrinogen-III C-methyltransferase [Agromyces badenianii]PWC03940.1 uroporphyrinogen-III C-methyltransferase [Agromyces badenianii]
MTGRVTLIGGGPGREDLLTLAAARALADAEVVLYDRLAPHERLHELAPGAELVDVGKRPGHHAVPQSEIEALLVAHALAGRRVVRLKGGDPYVLGRGSEELLACHAAGVQVEVIPGVTSAVAVPGAAGIPLTHRGISHLFTVVSGHAPLTDAELGHLAGLGGTIVVLMGVGSLPSLTAGLARHGMAARMPVAIIERGFRADQRTTIGDLTDIVIAAGRAQVASPAVVVIGEVVRLAHDGNASAAELMERAAGFAVVTP